MCFMSNHDASCTEKCRFLLKSPGTSGQIPDLGSGGGGGHIFIVVFNKRGAQELRIIILLHFLISNFSISLWETRELVTIIIFGFSDVSTTPKNQF